MIKNEPTNIDIYTNLSESGIQLLLSLDFCIFANRMFLEVAERNVCFLQYSFKHNSIILSIVGSVCVATKSQCQRFLRISTKSGVLISHYVKRIAQCRHFGEKSL